MGWAVAGIIVAILLAIGMWWYLKRARRLSTTNDALHDFQRNLLLELQDIRDKADGDLARALDELIDIARYDTPSSNEKTAELDEQITTEVRRLANGPSLEASAQIKELLTSRNRRVKR